MLATQLCSALTLHRWHLENFLLLFTAISFSIVFHPEYAPRLLQWLSKAFCACLLDQVSSRGIYHRRQNEDGIENMSHQQ